ncbi:vitellogenin receptor-like [Odontomachus brunneus]|uniref:vitellogenin receptor-like n=1 Tax=Odontomachus brunneus TaxID=486640 RepID=UPI0013F251EB|nr:vitellogenin receptor-like [Odontomachus brunneus]
MKTCKADGDEAVMIFSEGQKIRGIYLDSQTNFIVAEDLNQINQVAMDNEYIYWSTKDKKIMKATKNGKREYILITGLDEVSDIAVDWITGNIYFTDKGNMNIGVCDNNGTYCTILINGKTKKPTAIALLPTNGIMYWCDSSHKQYIAMAGMDGNDITLLITKKLKYPKSLTIDYPNNRLYWMDIGLMTIESIRLDGTDRKIISREINSQAMSLAIFENKIYWNVKINYHSYSDFDKTQKIQYCNAFSRCNQEILDTNRDYDASNDIQIYHPTMKSKVQNNCFLNPCSQLCLLNKNKNYTCACTLDKKLNSDGHTCQDTEDSQHIIIVADGTIVNYYHNLLGKPKITSSVIFRNITAITYDSLSGTILASNAFTDDIFRYDPISGEIENLIAMNIKSLGGMAFDYIGNNLYLTNIEEKTVEVHSLTTKTKKIFYFEEQSKTPYNIALAPEEGIMFVVFKVKDKYRIDKMQMDGTGTKSLFVESKLLKDSRISLYYHTDEKKIYWADQGSNSIQSALLTGFDYQIRTNLYNPISLTIAGEYIFWTQRHSTNLFWGNKNDIHKKNWEINFVDYINKETGISHLIMPYIIKDGYRKNCGNCSHVCLPSSANSYLCACPGDMTLSEDNHTCI